MKFKFNKNLDYQIEAINAVAEIFETGKNLINNKETFELQSSPIISNELEVDKIRILENLKNIQKQNNIEEVEKLDSMDFSVEMETGTGKTYVYLRTILELNKKYNLKKFIILVPSVAIREGVLKTIEQTKEHFREIYNTHFGYFSYDSKKLSRVREFAQSINIQIMIMTIQSFNKDSNIMRQTPDRFNGESPLNLVSKTKPVVIMDEPQNMESELSKSAISDLDSLFRLRYSATHKHIYNLVYRLTPYDAYSKGLVKKIEVYGAEESDPSAFIFKVLEIRTQADKLPQAKVILETKLVRGEFVNKETLLKAGDDLFRKTKNEKYQGLYVNEIDARINKVEISNGKIFNLEEVVGENKEVIFRTQIRETIKAHFNKQEELGNKIKVLSLFFIDKVDNYVKEDGIIKKIFVQEFEKLKNNFNQFKNSEVNIVHNGYFAKSKVKGEIIYKDTDGKTKDDKQVYDLIMKDKEKLLSFSEPISFIFSHSALKEGWDNPNIFQICTLREVRQEKERRQQIGRGLRLAVNTDGDRIFDTQTNVLTVIANESYKEFVGGLQTEYDEAGYKEIPRTADVRERLTIKFKKHLAIENEDFKKLWEKIRRRTKFNIELNTKKLIETSISKINELDINNLVVKVEKVQVDFSRDGKLETIYQTTSYGEKLINKISIDNIIDRIAKDTRVTRMTVFEIFSKINNLDLIFKNPEEFSRSCISFLNISLNELLINEGLKYIPTGNIWEVNLFEDFVSYAKKSIESKKSVYERVVFDSEGERQFAENLEKSNRVILFTKLPPNFFVDTPLGEYHPDWAIVYKGDEGEKLYLVRESKFVDNLENLRPSEKQKIVCGQKHFKSIDVDFKVATQLKLEDLLN